MLHHPKRHARASPRTSLGELPLRRFASWAFFGLSGLADYRSQRDSCGLTHSCAATDLTIARRELYVADLSFVVALGSLAAATYFVVTSRPSAGSVTTTVGVSPAPGGALARRARDVLTRGRLFECLTTPRRSCAGSSSQPPPRGRSWWFSGPDAGTSLTIDGKPPLARSHRTRSLVRLAACRSARFAAARGRRPSPRGLRLTGSRLHERPPLSATSRSPTSSSTAAIRSPGGNDASRRSAPRIGERSRSPLQMRIRSRRRCQRGDCGGLYPLCDRLAASDIRRHRG